MSNSVSAIILTQGLRDELKDCLLAIQKQDPPFSEVIVVNNSNIELDVSFLGEFSKKVLILSISGNFGTSARNIGAALTKGKFLVFIDDDIVLSHTDTVSKVEGLLSRNNAPSAVCFKVTAPDSDEFHPLSWGHPRDRREWQDRAFETDCITEGAFAIDSRIFRKVGGFWPAIFIGKEDVDLFLRLLRVGGRVEYLPQIQCKHLHSMDGRQPLRGFYHYSRSSILIGWRHLPFKTALAFLFRSYTMLAVQSIRSISLLSPIYILAGFIDGLCWIIGGSVPRDPISSETQLDWKKIRSAIPPVLRRLWLQLKQKNL
jgi:GT2 family glycosyltransferase